MKILLQLIFLAFIIASCNDNLDTKVKSNSFTNVETKKDSAISNPDNAIIKRDTSFVTFWTKFRSAVLNKDTSRIISLTKFPFETRGPLDDYPVVKFEQNKFLKIFTPFLNQWTGLKEGESEFDYIKKTTNPDNNDIVDNYARIGDLVFNRINGEWRLTFAYLNEETIEAINK